MMEFILIENPNGTFTLQETESAQNMHSKIGPIDEAKIIYADQTDLNTTRVIHDVGLGLAANAIAAIEKYRFENRNTPLLIQSFEKHTDGIKSGLQNLDHFEFLKPFETIIQTLLKNGEWKSDQITWQLFEGDYFELIKNHPTVETPDVLYFDFYAPKTCPELWGEAQFKELKYFLNTHPAKLITYSAATSIRTALLLAGFKVGPGQPTSYKSDTTLASNHADLITKPLKQSYLEKIRVSSQPFPLDWEVSTVPGEPQFEREREKLIMMLEKLF